MTPIVELQDVVRRFPSASGGGITAVDKVSFEIFKGRTLGLVGESGSGKSTVARLSLGITSPTSGSVQFTGSDVSSMKGQRRMEFSRRAQMVFQDPYSSLDPRMTVLRIISEPLDIHKVGTRSERTQRVKALLRQVGLRPEFAERFPHEMSGGQRQRVGIARALALSPEFLVCDEPVSALDVSVQAQVLNVLTASQRELGLSMLFITHDLAVARFVSDDIAVMYLGKIVEIGPRDEVLQSAQHPYTMALISTVPALDPSKAQNRIVLKGEIPSAASPPKGCRFHTRCPLTQDICRTSEPELRTVGEKRKVACHFSDIAADKLSRIVA